jgi:hypothetical protein
MSQPIWQRIVLRASLGLWQHKGSLLLGVIVLGAIGAYSFLFTPAQSTAAGAPTVSGIGGHDCADTVMAALAGSSNTDQQAYQCMDSTFQQRVSPQQFTTQLQTTGNGRGPITKVARVASYDAPAGTTLVYYAVDTSAQQSLGFIVYLGPNGKVLTIE